MALGDIRGILRGIGDSVSEAVSFNTTRIGEFSPELGSAMSSLITILKAAGIIIIAYIIFLIIKSLLGMRRNRRIDIVYHTVNRIDEKINILIEQNKDYRKLFEKKEAEGKFEKKSFFTKVIHKFGGKKVENPTESKIELKEAEKSRQAEEASKESGPSLPGIKKPEKVVKKKKQKKK